ncbi:response regulator [Sporofaciens sp. JLR.KK001]|jgi:two-component system response regulator YesN|uniref:response regulator transcription factor n=1 Tax=Sporofaciens sp. JLR.KK001 TaxID=3112621 RepID=UPI002FEF5D65
MIKILLADDEAVERRYFRNLFHRHMEYQVVGEAQNGVEIAELAEKAQPDVIIMDIHMPLMNGLESAHKIKERFPGMIIILNTAYADFEFAKKALDYRLDAYLLKPASEEQIIETIQSCMAHSAGRDLAAASQLNACRSIKNSPEQPENIVDILMKYIDENCYRNITLNELAELAHFTPSYVSKQFHRETGQTIKSYINQKKIENAKYLLANTRRTIQEVAQDSGFNNTSHFNRTFRQITDMTPLQYRQFIQSEKRRSNGL